MLLEHSNLKRNVLLSNRKCRKSIENSGNREGTKIMLFKWMRKQQGNLKYRHEFKYEIDIGQVIILKKRLSEILEKDMHVGKEEGYRIRSLYFDDYDDSCFYDNENGNEPREKYRIRIYNGSTDKIRLELKRKEAGKTLKYSCDISREQTELLMRGERISWEEEMPPLLKKLYIYQETRNLSPKVIVEYDRIPFVYKDGNVRVTLDLDICSSNRIEHFLDKDISRRPIMPKGKHLLEVKYDEFIPDFIKRTVKMDNLRQTTYSKYYLCRKFGGKL